MSLALPFWSRDPVRSARSPGYPELGAAHRGHQGTRVSLTKQLPLAAIEGALPLLQDQATQQQLIVLSPIRFHGSRSLRMLWKVNYEIIEG